MEADKDLQKIKKRLLELAKRSYSQGVYTFTPFLGLSEQQAYHEISGQLSYAGCGMEGGSPLCERKMIRFGNEESLGYVEDYPIHCLRIEPLNLKFAENLTHRDFLGAIMNLGIERDTVGDIFVQDKAAYLFCQDAISPYLTEHLEQVRRTKVRCVVSAVPEQLAVPSLESVTVSVASQRIDGVISKLYNMARSQSQELFGSGKIFINGRLMENGSYLLKPGDAVTVRGFGRFIYTGEQGETRKGKLRICVEVYR